MDTPSVSSTRTSPSTWTAAPAAGPLPAATQVTAARAAGPLEAPSSSAPAADGVQMSGEAPSGREALETRIADLTKRLDSLLGTDSKPQEDSSKVTEEDLRKRLEEMRKKLEELQGGGTPPGPTPEPPGGGGCDGGGGGCNGGGGSCDGGGGGGCDGGDLPPLDDVSPPTPPPSVDPNSGGDWDTKLIQACMAVLQEQSGANRQDPSQQPPGGGQQPANAPLRLGWGRAPQAGPTQGGLAPQGGPAPQGAPPPPPPPPPQDADQRKKQQSQAVQNLLSLYQQAKQAQAQLRPETEEMVQKTLATAGASLSGTN